MSQDHHLQQQRFELKYLVSEAITRSLRDFLNSYLELDDFGVGQPNFSYPVHSLYLDTDGLKTHLATQNGEKNRFKLRLRYYDDHPDAPVFFEIKGRVDNCILKRRCPVRREAVSGLLGGQLPGPEQILSKEPRHYGALQRFYQLMLQFNARPKAHNNYLREAWVSHENNSVRVTFDRHICIEPYFKPEAVVAMSQPTTLYPHCVVLEIKFTNRYPNWLEEMVQRFGLRQLSASKYSGGVALVGEHRFGRGVSAHGWPGLPLFESFKLAALACQVL
jgi:SPX domain protein involved in polyphosphate accumulation